MGYQAVSSRVFAFILEPSRHWLQIWILLLKPGEEVVHRFAAGRHGWLQVARGAVELNGKPQAQGDGAAIGDEKELSLKGRGDAEVLRFDLA